MNTEANNANRTNKNTNKKFINDFILSNIFYCHLKGFLFPLISISSDNPRIP